VRTSFQLHIYLKFLSAYRHGKLSVEGEEIFITDKAPVTDSWGAKNHFQLTVKKINFF
jgi:hypothetical protein